MTEVLLLPYMATYDQLRRALGFSDYDLTYVNFLLGRFTVENRRNAKKHLNWNSLQRPSTVNGRLVYAHVSPRQTMGDGPLRFRMIIS
jgi:hypothetical protein